MITQDAELLQKIKERFTDAENERKPWELDWQECTEFTMPRRSVWNEGEDEGRKPPRRIYNTRAIRGLKTASSGFQGNLVSRSTTWFRLAMRDSQLNEAYGVADWLEECEKAMIHELNRSNFFESLSELTPDGWCIGTATMFEDEGKYVVRFSPRHPFEMFYEVNEFGDISAAFRRFRLTAKQLFGQFGEDCHQNIKDDVESGKGKGRKLSILHAVIPSERSEDDEPGAPKKKWDSYYIDMDNGHIMQESGYYEFPYIVWRIARNSFEKYGRSPTSDALPDIKMANQMAKSRITLGQMIANPPMQIPEDMKGDEELIPDGRNYVPATMDIRTVIMGQNYPIAIDNEDRVDRAIDEHYFIDTFQLLSQAALMGKQRTATEVIELQGEKAAIMGTIIGSFETQVLSAVIARTFAILARRGVIPQPPPALQQGHSGIEVVYVGPLAQAQKKYHQSTGLTQALGLLGPIMQIDPGSLVWIDTGELMKEAMEGAGMPAKIIREKEDVQKIQQAQMQMQQQQQQMEQQQALMQNANKLNQTVEPGSLLEGMGKAAAAQAGSA